VNIALFPISLLMAFFLPGTIVSLRLRSRPIAGAAFIISSVLFFETLFLFQIAGICLSYWMIFGALAVLNVLLSFWCFRSTRFKIPINGASLVPSGLLEIFLFIPVLLSTLILALRAVMQPLSGYDTSFRWGWLGQEILRTGNFDFYPPLSSADFLHYFYVDAIPPMCQFSYFWLYASLGSVKVQWTAIFVVFQYLLIIFFCFRLTHVLAGRKAAFFAIATLSTSVIFFWSVVMGQETGLTALSVVATLYFIIDTKEGGERGAMTVAAFATALGVLAREYGWVFLLCGLAVAVYKKVGWRHVLLYVGTVIALAAPWYLRIWILSGNPVYSNPVGHLFPVNAVHVEILRHYESVFSLSVEPLQKLRFLGFLLISKSLLVVPAGLLGLWLLRRQYWIHLSLIVCGLTWMASVSYTAGGLYYSTRVLSPVFVLLAVASGAFLSSLQGRDWLIRGAIFVVVALVSATALLQESIVPAHVETIQSAQWYREGFTPIQPDAWAPRLFEGVPSGSRCLSDWAGAWVAMRGRGIEIIPVWSPDASVAFDCDTSSDAIVRDLRANNIQWVLISRIVNLDSLMAQSPLYRALMRSSPWRVAESGKFALFFLGDVRLDGGSSRRSRNPKRSAPP